jgi:hypothetical protein
MGAWLTTGAMIDNLQVGQIAESDSNGMIYKVKRDDYGIKFCNIVTEEILTGDYKCLTAREYFMNRKWRIKE